MKQVTHNNYSKLFALGLGAFVFGAQAQATTNDVRINVYGIHSGGAVVYRYQIDNASTMTIDSLDLGLIEPGKELPSEPWMTTLHAPEDGSPMAVDGAHCKPFAGMRCQVSVFQFDYMPTPAAVIYMDSIENGVVPEPAVFSEADLIRPKTLSSVAEIVSPVRRNGYLTAYGKVRFIDAKKGGTLSLDIKFTRTDTTKPTITGTTSVVAASGRLKVTAHLTPKDSIDPAPEIRLTTVTANQTLAAGDVVARLNADTRSLDLKQAAGRVYTLAYRAIDGSSNYRDVLLQVASP